MRFDGQQPHCGGYLQSFTVMALNFSQSIQSKCIAFNYVSLFESNLCLKIFMKYLSAWQQKSEP